MSMSQIKDEFEKFEIMFKNKNYIRENTKNVLFICSTGYDNTVMSRFNNKLMFSYSPGSEYVDKVYVLDLTCVNSRTNFFGLKPGSTEARVLEDILAKTRIELKK